MPDQLPTTPHQDNSSEVEKPMPRPDFMYDPTPANNRRHISHLHSIAPKPDKRTWWKRLIISLGFLAVLGGLIFGIFALKNIIKVAPNFFKLDQKLKGEDKGRVNILLLGIGDPGHDGATLSDTNIIVSVDTINHKVAMTSIPRDTRVKIPGYGYSKINNANAYGDTDLAQSTVEDFLDIPINYYVKTDFSGLKQAVNAVGGVDVNNQYTLSDPDYPCDNNQWRSCGFKMKAGPQHLDGVTALKYARCRKGTCGDDEGRAARQQEVLTQLRTKAMSLGTILNPGKLTSLITAAGDNVKTDLSIGEMMRLNELTKDTPSDQFINFVLSIKNNGFLKNSPDGSSDLVPIDNTLQAIQGFEKDIFRLGPIWKEDPIIVIQNGTATVGLGVRLQTRLNKDKLPITIAEVTNALTKDYKTTKLLDYKNGSKPNTKKYLEDTLKVSASPPDNPPKNPAQDFVVIIGDDYGNYLPTPTTSPASR